MPSLLSSASSITTTNSSKQSLFGSKSSRRGHSGHSLQQQRRRVLPEDDYVRTMTQIIRNDYYPDLAELEQQIAYQTKYEQGDYEGAVAVRRAAQLLRHEEQRQLATEDEYERDGQLGGVRNQPRPLGRESLTGFHARVTSEDNAEFDTEQQNELRENRQRREQWLALIVPTTNVVTTTTECDMDAKVKGLPNHNVLALASDQFNPPAADSQATLLALQPNTAENSLFFVPSAAPNGPDSDPVAACLMPPPKSLAVTQHNNQQIASLTAATTTFTAKQTVPTNALIEYIPKRQLEKKIDPTATRFNHTHKDNDLAATFEDDHSSYCCSETDASTDLDEYPPSVDVERQQAAKRRRIEQSTLVNSHPTHDHPTTRINHFRLPAVNHRDQAAVYAQAKLDRRARQSQAAARSKTQFLSAQRPSSSSSTISASVSCKSSNASVYSNHSLVSARSAGAFASALRHAYMAPPIVSSTSSLSSSKRSIAGHKSKRSRPVEKREKSLVRS